ncbi:hypothetical protein AWC22_21655 [Mycobacterium riyadhense]|uniref:Uncharacterized protein n=1 Tax=Mycobacterium riyadhense TaxID=486698 RepID=A0A1X2CK15_9MYCO|nr:hypothetical protein AWC22_21655 [Mycobacterium riyadhense]
MRGWSLRLRVGEGAGPELPVAGISETRHDICRLIEPFVDRHGEHPGGGRRFFKRRKSFRCGHHTEHDEFRCAAAFQQFDGLDHRPTSCQHGIEDHYRPASEIVGQLLHVRDRLVGFLVARHTDEPDLGLRYRSLCLVDHPQAGPQHGNQ